MNRRIAYLKWLREELRIVMDKYPDKTQHIAVQEKRIEEMFKYLSI